MGYITYRESANYRIAISEERIDADSFAVCLVDVPDFPNEGTPFISRKLPVNTGLLCSRITNQRWDFFQLDDETHYLVGSALIDAKADKAIWYYCHLSAKRLN